jgi:hypothetical protein
MVAHTCYNSTQEAQAGGSQVRSQPGLHGETLSQKKRAVTTTKFFKVKPLRHRKKKKLTSNTQLEGQKIVNVLNVTQLYT